jgi:DNA-3-methyladenine glycosylase
LFNVVTNIAGTPHAVLIRAGKPLEGSDVMRKRRGKRRTDKMLLEGPGSLAQALGITTNLTGTSLLGNRIWIEDQRIPLDAEAVIAGPRIGVNYAAEDAKRVYRFRVDIDGPSHVTR